MKTTLTRLVEEIIGRKFEYDNNVISARRLHISRHKKTQIKPEQMLDKVVFTKIAC